MKHGANEAARSHNKIVVTQIGHFVYSITITLLQKYASDDYHENKNLEACKWLDHLCVFLRNFRHHR